MSDEMEEIRVELSDRTNRGRKRYCLPLGCLIPLLLAVVLFFGACAGVLYGVDRVMRSNLEFGLGDLWRVYWGFRRVDERALPQGHGGLAGQDEFFRRFERSLFLLPDTVDADLITGALGRSINGTGGMRASRSLDGGYSGESANVGGGDPAENLFAEIFNPDSIDFDRLIDFCEEAYARGEYLMNVSGNDLAAFVDEVLQSRLADITDAMLGYINLRDFDVELEISLRVLRFGRYRNNRDVVTGEAQISIYLQGLINSLLGAEGREHLPLPDFPASGAVWGAAFGTARLLANTITPSTLYVNATIGLSEAIPVEFSFNTMSERQIESLNNVVGGVAALREEDGDFINDMLNDIIEPITEMIAGFLDFEQFEGETLRLDPFGMLLSLAGIGNVGEEDGLTSLEVFKAMSDIAAARNIETSSDEVSEERALGQINKLYYRRTEYYITSLAQIFEYQDGEGALLYWGSFRQNIGQFRTEDFVRDFNEDSNQVIGQPGPFIRDSELRGYFQDKLESAVGGGTGKIHNLTIGQNGGGGFTLSMLVEYNIGAFFGDGDPLSALFSKMVDTIFIRTYTVLSAEDGAAVYPTEITINNMDFYDGAIAPSAPGDSRRNLLKVAEALSGSLSDFCFYERAAEVGRMLFDYFDAEGANSIRSNLHFYFAIDGEYGGIILPNFYGFLTAHNLFDYVLESVITPPESYLPAA